MKAVQKNLAKLGDTDTQVLGVSMDSPFSNFALLNRTESPSPCSATGEVQ
jgi:alkyl hydroperoxide reductase subunit AhpC